ncbi:MAG: aminopeptidase [Candidatus Marinimicrobia bacterium]|nr:aminopeptidase [Candidatus Neomarinimicrobiota bacterium]|tara:strand:- start:966 stop:2141 length:1176 start_codon:yes stop_codon:yes gene_type:complete
MSKSFYPFKINRYIIIAIFIAICLFETTNAQRKRARDVGVEIGLFKTGKWNAITDIKGVEVGHETIIRGDNIRTGVTIIKPHTRDLFSEKVMAAVHVINGFGKAIGFTQVNELGTIETPIALTNTLNVFLVGDAIVEYMISNNSNIRSVNPVVGETNDSGLNDIQGRHVQKRHVYAAINKAKSGPVEEGSVGAGTGTRALGFKGGIGTSSRILPQDLGGYSVGVLVQSNFGSSLVINGAPVGRELHKSAFSSKIPYDNDEGSCMIVIATDAPLSNRNLKRLAKRAVIGMGNVGGFISNGSGDYVIAFSTFSAVSRQNMTTTRREVNNNAMNSLFMATVEATEEAILNSLFMAETVSSKYGTANELPLDKTLEILNKYNSLNWNNKLYPWKK